ncbi:hypothetical protein KSP40_PGU004012 [Platanthera guangdongensis]|uniref:Rho-GAP domain-containing protein n=1 Tax=Platanthera guangdongensis TaxID=2320717 RepID=A0ABR2MBE2_9ASPA
MIPQKTLLHFEPPPGREREMAGVAVVTGGRCRGSGKKIRREEEKHRQISLSALLTAAFRKSLAQCHLREEEKRPIDIGWPSEVHHIAHVTFDRFHGFLGLPIEFELQIPHQSPSASTMYSVNVFGISPESMQCEFDSKGNSVPTVLLLMQERLYSQGGLKAEGIFRINPENGKEKEVREQLSKGVLPDDIDAWFRELPEGLMDSLSPGHVLLCESEEDYAELVRLLPPIQYALFSWAIELMVDVVEEEESNKMNLSDPLTSLMHAVQVMNLLKTLVIKALREREEHVTEIFWPSTCSRSSHGHVRGGLFEEDMSDGLNDYEDEHSSSYYEDKDVEDSGDSRRDSAFDCCSITEELVKDIEECFLNQLQWKEE